MSKADDLLAKWAEEDRQILHAGVQQLVSTAEGRSVIFQLIRNSGLWDTSPYSKDAKLTAFHLGRQEAARELLEAINGVDPFIWPSIQLEVVKIDQERRQMLDAVELEDEEDG